MQRSGIELLHALPAGSLLVERAVLPKEELAPVCVISAVCSICDWTDYTPCEEHLQHSSVPRDLRQWHSRSDWHRYNSDRVGTRGKPPVTKPQFLAIVESLGSSSEEEDTLTRLKQLSSSSEDEDENAARPACSRFIFTLADRPGRLSTWSCFVGPEPSTQKLADFVCLLQTTRTLIFLCGGGYFAGALFSEAGAVVAHRAIRRYTVRRSQGTSQSLKDATKRCRSAGSWIRRHNEVALRKEALDALTEWIGMGNVGLCFSNGSVYNSSLVKEAASVPPLRSIPFTTYRATFAEVQRCHRVLFRPALA